MTLGERLKRIRTSIVPKMSQEDFAVSLGKTRAAYTMYEIDRVVPDETFLQLVSSKYGVSMLWLETGEGDPYIARSSSANLAEEIRDLTKGEHPLMAAVLASLAAMPPQWCGALSEKLHQEPERVS